MENLINDDLGHKAHLIMRLIVTLIMILKINLMYNFFKKLYFNYKKA